MSYEFLSTNRDGPVEYLTLNRPDVRNAFNEHVIRELTEWAARTRAAAERHEVRIVVLAGAGTTFCAGADVTWMSKTVQYTEDENVRDASAMSHMFGALDQLPLALVGRIQGAALGGGAGLAAICDIVIAADDALFGFSEVKLGILPAVISPFVLAKIGAHARRYFTTGERFDAEAALRIGLVHELADDVAGAVARIVREVLQSGPAAVRAAKRLALDEPADGEELARLAAGLRAGAEGQEGLLAFLEKREASWRR